MYSAVVLWFVIIACFGLYSFVSGQYSEIFSNNGVFPLIPFVYCFISVVILLYPLKKFDYRRIEFESLKSLNNYKLVIMCRILLVLYILLTFVYASKVISNFLAGNSLAELYNKFHDDGQSVFGYSEWESKVIWIISPINTSLYWFIVVVSFFKINKNKGNKIFWILLFIFNLLPDVMNYMSRSARGEFLYTALKYIFIFIPLWQYLNKPLKKYIIRVSIIVVCLAGLYTIVISNERLETADASQNSKNSIIRYMGEAYPNLSNQIWEKVRFHPMGIRMFPFFIPTKLQTGNSIGAQQEFWERITGVPMLNFKTIYGDFYIEFGPILAIVIISIISFMMNIFLKRKQIYLSDLPIIGVYLHILVLAPLFFSYGGMLKFYSFILSILFYLFIKYFLSSSTSKLSKANKKLEINKQLIGIT